MPTELGQARVATEEDYVSVALLFKALAHPMRLKLVCGLLKQPCTQTHIARTLNLPQSSVAQHLAVLRRAGIVGGTRDGTLLTLEVVDPRVPALLAQICKQKNIKLDILWDAEKEIP